MFACLERLGLILGLTTAIALASPASLLAQGQYPDAEAEDEETDAGAVPIEWNFQPVSAATSSSDLSLQERWAAPFAVVSRGRIAPRGPREVVTVRESAAPLAEEPAADDSVTAAPVAEETPEIDDGDAVPEAEGDADAEEESGGSEGAGAQSGRAAETGSATRSHRVAYGETWFGLARQYRVSAQALAVANPSVDPERLRAGTVLSIPASGEDGGARSHTVVSGDTLYGIARRYGVTAAAIRSANSLSGDVVRLGQTLVIPQEEASR